MLENSTRKSKSGVKARPFYFCRLYMISLFLIIYNFPTSFLYIIAAMKYISKEGLTFQIYHGIIRHNLKEVMMK